MESEKEKEKKEKPSADSLSAQAAQPASRVGPPYPFFFSFTPRR
jgi:hypothetical protein